MEAPQNIPTPRTAFVISQCEQYSDDIGVIDLSKMFEHSRRLERELTIATLALERISIEDGRPMSMRAESSKSIAQTALKQINQ